MISPSKWSSAMVCFVLAFCLTGCSTNPNLTLVADYIAKTENIDVKSIKITEISEPTPWTGLDSLEVLKAELEANKAEIKSHLEKAIESSNIAIASAEESMNGGFAALKPIAEETIAQSKETIERANVLLEAINSDFKGTVAEGLYNRVQSFEDKKEDILFQLFDGEWTVSGSEESKEFHLIADKDLTAIIGSSGQ